MPPRRRRTAPEGAAPTESPSSLAEPEGQSQANVPAESGQSEQAEPSAAETPRRRRRTTRRKQAEEAGSPAEGTAAESPAVEEPPSVAVAMLEPAETSPSEIPVPAEMAIAESPPEAAVEEAPKTTRRRRSSTRRRAKTAVTGASVVVAPEEAATPTPQAQEQPSAVDLTETPVPEVVPEEPEAVVTVQEAVTAPPKRRRRARRTAEEGPVEETALAEEEQPDQRRRRREGVRLGIRQGHPEIIIDDEPVAPLFFFGNIDTAASEKRVCEQIRQAASAGVHLHSLLLDLPVSVPMVSHGVTEALRLLHLVRQNDPNGYLMFRVVFSPPPDWQKLYPEAMTTYADGSTGDPSFASERYWQEAEAALTLLVRHLEVSEEARSIIGYHLDCREWFYEFQRGYDYSPAAQEAFRQWLRARYKNDLVALRASWHDGSVTFTSASVPTYHAVSNPPTVLYEYRRGQRYVDYLRFASDVIARRIITLSRTVKRNSENRRLVAVSYGYLLDFPVPHSGHLALSEVLSAQSIDLICAPVSYRDRRPTQPGSVPVPVASVRLRGKLFVLEDDTKPHTSQNTTPDDYNPRCSDAEATRNVRLRNCTTALTHHAGIAWMDLWGEGWAEDNELWQMAQRLRELYLPHIRGRLPEAPEVAVIVDEHSLTRIQSPTALLEPLVLQQQEVLARAGIHYGIYLQSDLTRKAFPEAKVYLFLNPIEVSGDVREAIRERLHRDGKVLVWLYAVALYDENGYTSDGPRDVAGIAIKAQPWNSETGSIISNDRHPITERLRNKQIGVRERVNPSFYVLDEKVTVLGEYLQTGLPSIAVKDMGNWRSVFIGERQLTVDLVRGLCRFAGVHVWSQSSDAVRVAPPFIAVHSVGDGVVHLQLPQRQVVYDLTEGRLLAEDASNLRLNMRTGQTGLYVVGSYEQLTALGVSLPERTGETMAETAGASTIRKRRRRGGKKHRKRRE